MLFETLLLIASLSQSAGDANNLHVNNCDFGEIYAFGTTSCEFSVENLGDTPVKVSQFSAVSQDDQVEFRELTVASHSTAYVRAQIRSGNALGPIRHKFILHAGSTQVQANAFGFVLSAFDPSPTEVNLGVVDITSTQTSKEFKLQNAASPNFKLLKIIDKPTWLDASISGDRQGIVMDVPKSTPVQGVVADFVKVETDSAVQREVWISVQADIRGDVVPSFNPMSMGVMHIEDTNEFRIPLQSKSGKSFRIGKVSLSNIDAEVTVRHCIPESQACQWLSLEISKSQPKGTIKGDVVVELPEEHRQLKIGLRGLLLDNTAKIKTLDPNREDLGLSETPQLSSYTHASTDLGSALKKAISQNQPKDSAPAGNGPLLKWTISNAQDVHGFQVFRADIESGPFILLNTYSIPNDRPEEDSASFQWRDKSAEAQKVYWYEVGLILNNGRKQLLTDPVKVVAK